MTQKEKNTNNTKNANDTIECRWHRKKWQKCKNLYNISTAVQKRFFLCFWMSTKQNVRIKNKHINICTILIHEFYILGDHIYMFQKWKISKKWGGEVVAISPDSPREARRTRAQNGLTMRMLSDPGNTMADQHGLRSSLVPIYAQYELEWPVSTTWLTPR